MIFNTSGFPKDNGATDFLDSSRLAGMLVISKNPQAVDCSKYFVDGNPTRCPSEPGIASNPHTFSRDQLVVLAAGLMLQGHKDQIASMYKKAEKAFHLAPNNQNDDGSKKWFGGDFIASHIMGALAKAAGLHPKLSIMQSLLLKFNIWLNNKRTPLNESNQLIAVCVMAGPEYVRQYRDNTPQWKQAILNYWALSYRNEPEIANALIDVISKY